MKARKVWRMKSLKIETLRVSSLKVGASLELESLKRNPAWKFEARGNARCAKEQGEGPLETRRGSQSSPQARVRKFESSEFESLKPRKLES